MNENVMDFNLEPPPYLEREEKLKWLMVSYGNDVIRVAYSYLKQKQLAEDVAQEVFIKCYEKMDSFRHESTYKTWLIRITVNRCKDVLKSFSYKNLLVADFFGIRQNQSSYEQVPFANDENQFLSQQVMNLPVKYREVIILFYYQELSIEEIADFINSNPSTIKTRLHRGRLKLKEALERNGSNGGK